MAKATTTTTPKTPAKAKATETKAKKTTKKADAPEPAPPVVQETAPETDAAPEPPTEDNALAEQSMAFLSKLQQLNTWISSMKTEFRALEKAWTREVKTLQKKSGRTSVRLVIVLLVDSLSPL